MRLITSTFLSSVLFALPCYAQLPDWTNVQTAAAPSARVDHGMVFDSFRNVTVLFGGSTNSGQTWEYDGTNWSLKTPTASPPNRDVPGMAFDSIRGVTVLFGGVDGVLNVLRDHWEYNGATWTKIRIPAAFKPTARSRASMCYDSARLRTILFGGYDTAKGAANDTWEFNGTIWNQVMTPASPPGRQDQGMAYDPVRNRTVMFGGSAGGDLGDTWEYDGTTWTQMMPANSPPAMHGVELCYDTVRKKVVLFGGHGSAVFDTTWEWDGVNWVLIPTKTLPAAREQHAVAHDSNRGKTVVFSGTNGGSDTWEYSGGGCILTADTPSISISNGGAQTLSVEAPAHAGKSYWIFGSISGTSPGVSLLGVNIPLNPDLYTNFTIASPNAPPFTTFRGPLDAAGKGTGVFTLPANVLTATFAINHAFVVFDANGNFHCASNAVELQFIQ